MKGYSLGITERREREKEQRKNDIVDAAEKIFFSKGIDRATMDEVAEEAELSKGTLYLYFKSKEELYLAIHVRGLRILENMFREALQKAQTGIDKVREIGKTYHRYYEEYPDYFNAMVYYESHDIDFDKNETCANTCQEQGEQTLQVVGQAIQIGIEDGSIRPGLDPLKTAVVLWGHSTGIIQILSLKGAHLEKEHKINIAGIFELSMEMTLRSLIP